VNSVIDVRQTEVHTDEPLVPGPSRLEAEIAIAKSKKYKSPGSDKIAELIPAGGEILLSQNYLIRGRSLLFRQFKKWGIKFTVVITVGYHCYRFHTNVFKYTSLKVKSIYG
jgi:hypothetical protein